MPIKQSLCIPCYHSNEDDLNDFLDFVKDTGFAGVEIWGRDSLPYFEAFCEGMNSRGLVIPSMGGHGSIESGLNDLTQHERIEAELVDSIDVAVEKDIKSLICFGGDRQPGQSDADAMVVCAKGLRRVLPYAEEKGINLNMELLNSKIDHFNYVADHFEWGFALAELIDSPRFKLLFDIYHMQIMDGDIIRNIRRGIHRIGHFHTAGHPGRHDIDDRQEIHYPGICNAIAATDYDGFVAHEFFTDGDDKRAPLAAAFEICNV
jgi:hydroxypyruvate isomerase